MKTKPQHAQQTLNLDAAVDAKATTARKATDSHARAIAAAYDLARQDGVNVVAAVTAEVARLPSTIRGAALRRALRRCDAGSPIADTLQAVLRGLGAIRPGAGGGAGKSLTDWPAEVRTRKNGSNPTSNRFLYIGQPAGVSSLGQRWTIAASKNTAGAIVLTLVQQLD